jgi:hypothetical protein
MGARRVGGEAGDTIELATVLGTAGGSACLAGEQGERRKLRGGVAADEEVFVLCAARRHPGAVENVVRQCDEFGVKVFDFAS